MERNMFKKIVATCALVATLTIGAVSAWAGSVTFTWGGVPDANLAGYKLYYTENNTQPFVGTGATQGASPVTIPKNVTTFTLNGLDVKKTYYFAVTAFNDSNQESAYSNIVSITAPWFPSTVTLTLGKVTNDAPAQATATKTISVVAPAK